MWGHGILISDLQILSAAHCFEGKTIDEVLKEAVAKPFHTFQSFIELDLQVIVIVGTDNAEAELRKFNWKTLFNIELNPFYTDFRQSLALMWRC